MEQEILKFYFSRCDADDAEEQTCVKFGIDEDTLNFILMSDFVEVHMGDV